MKNWVILGLVAVAAYWMYDSWFSSDGDDPGSTPDEVVASAPDVHVPVSEAPKAEPEAKAKNSFDEPVRLDLGGGSDTATALQKPEAEDVSWALHLERKQALDRGETAVAAKLKQRILREFPASDAARWIHFERGRAALQEYRKLKWQKGGMAKAQEARKYLTPALFLEKADPNEREELIEVLADLNEDVLLKGREVPGATTTYTPKRGDNLDTLCRRVFRKSGSYTTPGFVAYMNRLKSPRHLRAREPVRVPVGRPTIVVVKSAFRLYFLFDGAYVKDFQVGLGREDSTPESTFTIAIKQEKPDWYPDDGVRIAYGDPRNILGSRWMGFKNSTTYRGFGIHGTTEPSSIGKQASSGCIRMLRADIEQLYDWTPPGTKVQIRR
ncbi:MAG: L,D-transpeptidase [Planctomycetota bacterium]|jgi:hypothetical protein